MELDRSNKWKEELWLLTQCRAIHEAPQNRPRTLQELWRDSPGRKAGEPGKNPEPDKYAPNADTTQDSREQMLKWLIELEHGGQEKDRSRSR